MDQLKKGKKERSMPDEKRTESTQNKQTEVEQLKQKPQELTDEEVEKVIGGAAAMKKAVVPTTDAVDLSGAANPLCII